MKGINKKQEPNNFERWRKDLLPKKVDGSFDTEKYYWGLLKDFKESDPRKDEFLEKHEYVFGKKDLRTALIKEQQYLCCYCCCRIENEGSKTKIEHFEPREEYGQRMFDYDNLHLACPGEPSKEITIKSEDGKLLKKRLRLHCDTSKGNKFEKLIEGQIVKPISPLKKIGDEFVVDTAFQYVEGKILPIVDENKQAIYTIDLLNLNLPLIKDYRVNALFAFEYDESTDDYFVFSEEEAQQLYDAYSDATAEQLPEYCDMLLYYLKVTYLSN